MRHHFALVAVTVAALWPASLTGASASVDASGTAGALAGTWGTAAEVLGTAALNQGGIALTTSVSCASAGNCSAGGQYMDASVHRQAFVVSQVNGTWQAAIEVPGTAALNQGGNAEISSVSCASVGSCSAGGYYRDAFSQHQAFVVSQVNGTWHAAI